MYLLDTDVVSGLRGRRHPAVVAWVQSLAPQDIYLSAITIAEIQRGASSIREKDPEFSAEITEWLEEGVLARFPVLPFDAAAAQDWGRMALGEDDPNWIDAMIAAIARTQSLTVATGNVRHFRLFDVKLLNPFDYRA